jgi:hypothetical protein
MTIKNKTTNKQHLRKKETPGKKSKYSWAIFGVVILAPVVGVIFWMNTKIDQNQLVGRWVRTDSEGNYIIEIKSAADGKLDASYFNPNPIKVGRAEWQQKNGSLVIVVELQDVNYPGSTYTLNLLPAQDRLTGNYYQAVEGTNFNVEFVRTR